MTQERQGNYNNEELESCLNEVEISNYRVSELELKNQQNGFFTSLKINFFTQKGIKRILNSNKLHILVIILVIIDCVCISVELVIDFVINYNKEHRHLLNIQSPNSTSSSGLFEVLKGIDLKSVSILASIEHTLRFVSLGILTFFVLEIVLKLTFVPDHVIKSVWGVLDAIVVCVSFILDILLLNDKQILHTVTGFLTLFRLWRIARILSGILVTMEKKSAKKILKLTKTIKYLTNENKELREQLEKNRHILEKFMVQDNRNLDEIFFVKPLE